MKSPSPHAVPHQSGSARVVALIASDTIALFGCGLLAYLLWGAAVRDQPESQFVRLTPLVPLFLLSYAFGGMYPGFGVNAIRLIRTASRQTSLVFLVVVGSIYVLRLPGDYSRGTLGLWWVMALVGVPMARAAVAGLAVSSAWWKEPVLMIGDADRLRVLADTLARALHIGYRPVAVVLTPAPPERQGATWQGLPVVHQEDVVDAARRLGVRTILLSATAPDHEQWAAELSEHIRHVISTHALEDRFIEPVGIRYLGTSIGIEIQNRLLMRRNQLLKRTVDVAIAAIGLILVLPVLVIAAVAVTLRDPGPWWHVQTREGRGGRPFRMWKLRTMYLDAERRLAAHLAADPRASEEWGREFKLVRDPRVLPGVGTLLRRWSLDECPQFWNVIRGDMSLVGPRALPLYHLEAFGPAFRRLRQRIRPGMTGMWQVMSRGSGAVRTQEALDSYYIYNWSIWTDIFILGKTVLTVISGKGAR